MEARERHEVIPMRPVRSCPRSFFVSAIRAFSPIVALLALMLLWAQHAAE